MQTEGDMSVQGAEQLIRQVFQERENRGVHGCDQDTAVAGALLRREIAEGREVALAKLLLEGICRGRVFAELLSAEDADEVRIACPVEYGNHVGDFLFHFVN